MRKNVIIAAILAIASTVGVAMAGTPVNSSELPEGAKTFLQKYFADDAIRSVEKDHEFLCTEFDVDLASGAEVDFLASGQWKDVKAARGKTVPLEIVPDAIAGYVASNHKDQKIIEISRERIGFEVELTDGTDLHMTADGKLLHHRDHN